MSYYPSRVNQFFVDGASIDMNIDGDTTPTWFKVGPSAAGEVWKCARLLWNIIDGGMTPTEFAGLGAELTNGLQVCVVDDNNTILYDFLDGQTIKKNADFAWLAGTDSLVTAAAGDDWLPVRWTLEKQGDVLHLQFGEYLGIHIQDDLSALTEATVMLQGLK